jgi:hypothetical protein
MAAVALGEPGDVNESEGEKSRKRIALGGEPAGVQ